MNPFPRFAYIIYYIINRVDLERGQASFGQKIQFSGTNYSFFGTNYNFQERITTFLPREMHILFRLDM